MSDDRKTRRNDQNTPNDQNTRRKMTSLSFTRKKKNDSRDNDVPVQFCSVLVNKEVVTVMGFRVRVRLAGGAASRDSEARQRRVQLRQTDARIG